jgi:hypothetical protein
MGRNVQWNLNNLKLKIVEHNARKLVNELPLLVLVDSPTNSNLYMNCIPVLSTNTLGPPTKCTWNTSVQNILPIEYYTLDAPQKPSIEL